MLTLTYGFKKPQTGDKGSVFWPALEDDIQQLNDHTHNGVDSASLPSSSITAVTQTNGAWTDNLDGTYTLSCTHAAGTSRTTHTPVLKDSSRNTIFVSPSYSSATAFTFTINGPAPSASASYIYYVS